MKEFGSFDELCRRLRLLPTHEKRTAINLYSENLGRYWNDKKRIY